MWDQFLNKTVHQCYTLTNDFRGFKKTDLFPVESKNNSRKPIIKQQNDKGTSSRHPPNLTVGVYKDSPGYFKYFKKKKLQAIAEEKVTLEVKCTKAILHKPIDDLRLRIGLVHDTVKTIAKNLNVCKQIKDGYKKAIKSKRDIILKKETIKKNVIKEKKDSIEHSVNKTKENDKILHKGQGDLGNKKLTEVQKQPVESKPKPKPKQLSVFSKNFVSKIPQKIALKKFRMHFTNKTISEIILSDKLASYEPKSTRTETLNVKVIKPWKPMELKSNKSVKKSIIQRTYVKVENGPIICVKIQKEPFKFKYVSPK
ncbi:unnamed protein product [Brassicogethes aeneus]|uniref:Uncharacterized protein n=1 Tax=Brassicogethes aeneus TaxID=1431903 RepID=A0A9P0F874_BRAAE|nr:unnamed protein product [Brassicogethes aeneus]